jgi:hypothetical protein
LLFITRFFDSLLIIVRIDPLPSVAGAWFPVGRRLDTRKADVSLEQIPQVVTCASISHTQTITTALGVFLIHQISPEFFFGYNWYKQSGDFLIASPEKALLDCLYLSGRRGNHYRHFPEFHFPKSFNFIIIAEWINGIRDERLRTYVRNRLREVRGNV